MDAEVRKSKAHVREREAAIRNKVEQVGRRERLPPKGKMLNGCKVFRVADPRSSGKK